MYIVVYCDTKHSCFVYVTKMHAYDSLRVYMNEYFMSRKINSNFLYKTIIKYMIVYFIIDVHIGNVPSCRISHVFARTHQDNSC